jgi:hypothetical protein
MTSPDMHPHDEITEADLAALADGSVAPTRREELLRRVEASPQLARRLADQRVTLAAIHATGDTPAPASLHAAIAAMTVEASGTRERDEADSAGGAREARSRSWTSRLPRWSLPLAAALAVVAVALVVVLSQGGGTPPNVTEAARVALAPTHGAAPEERAGTGELAASVDGVAYPYWAKKTTWRAVGTRRDVLRDRTITTVAYANARGQRIGYAIAAGDALPVTGGRTVVRDGTRFRLLRSNGAVVVTWLRNGHTCVLAARDVSPGVMLGLASWR